MLRALGVHCDAQREIYPQDMKDISLFMALEGKELVYVAADLRQLTRECEAIELKRCKITGIYFAPFWSKLKFWEQAAWLVKKWPTIDGFVTGVERGTCAEIKQNGRAHLLNV